MSRWSIFALFLGVVVLAVVVDVASACGAGDCATILTITNQFRAEKKLKPLKCDSKLTSAAQAHATDMATKNFFSHKGSDGSQPQQRAARRGYTSTYVAENIAAGSNSPSYTMEQWRHSPGHYENIMDPHMVDMGCGFASNPKAEFIYYWVSVFGNMDSTGGDGGDGHGDGADGADGADGGDGTDGDGGDGDGSDGDGDGNGDGDGGDGDGGDGDGGDGDGGDGDGGDGDGGDGGDGDGGDGDGGDGDGDGHGDGDGSDGDGGDGDGHGDGSGGDGSGGDGDGGHGHNNTVTNTTVHNATNTNTIPRIPVRS